MFLCKLWGIFCSEFFVQNHFVTLFVFTVTQFKQSLLSKTIHLTEKNNKNL